MSIEDRLRRAHQKIISIKDDVLGDRTKPRGPFDCPQAETEAFDRGCRMAFYRCAEISSEALAATQEQRGEPGLTEDDANFLELVATVWSRADGDPSESEGLWALRLRAIAAAIRNGAAPPTRFDGERALAEFEATQEQRGPEKPAGLIRCRTCHGLMLPFSDAVSSSERDAQS